MTPQSGSAQTRKPHSCFLAGLTPRRPTLMTIFGDGVLARERAHADPFEFGHDAFEPLAGKPGAAQCGTEVGPIQELRARCRELLPNARRYEQALYVPLPPAVDFP